MMEKKLLLTSISILIIICVNQALFGQTTLSSADTLRKGAVKVFLDCHSCDMNYTRQEIPYVNYVRDVNEAEVYILVTSQRSGSGGNESTYTFVGQDRFLGVNDTLVYNSNPNQTSAEIREKRTDKLKIGLMRYVSKTPISDELKITHNSKLEEEQVLDRWNNWVFRLQTSPKFNAEKSYSKLSFTNSVDVSKITPDLKFEISMDQSTNKSRYIYDDGSESIYIKKENKLRNLIVGSISEHWSAGLTWMVESSTSSNYDLNCEIMPAIEYDIFPYKEATRRQLRILYSAGYQYSNYIDTSINLKLKENLLRHELKLAYQVQEKWGYVNLSLTGSNYFHDLRKNKLQLNTYISLRILKGLSLSLNGGVAYINDQLNLRKGALSDAERLLRLKEQATNFSIQGGVSITFTFGSIYNNVVNPRFGSSSGSGGGN
jgi:hypothetical protein